MMAKEGSTNNVNFMTTGTEVLVLWHGPVSNIV